MNEWSFIVAVMAVVGSLMLADRYLDRILPETQRVNVEKKQDRLIVPRDLGTR